MPSEVRRQLFVLPLILALILMGPAAWAQQVSTGVIKPLDDLKLSLTVAGRIEAVLAREGTRVRKGDVILHLDKTLEELEVSRRLLLLNDRSKLDEAIAREQTLKGQVEHARRLLETNTISRKQLEDEELALSAVVSDRQAMEVMKKREQVEYELARENLARRFLYAPIDGEVIKIHYQIGESVAMHEPLVRLVDVSRVRFTGNVGARTAARIRTGSQLAVRLGPESGSRTRKGRVVFVSPVADLASGLVEVKVELDNADGGIRPGTIGALVISADR